MESTGSMSLGDRITLAKVAIGFIIFCIIVLVGYGIYHSIHSLTPGNVVKGIFGGAKTAINETGKIVVSAGNEVNRTVLKPAGNAINKAVIKPAGQALSIKTTDKNLGAINKAVVKPVAQALSVKQTNKNLHTIGGKLKRAFHI